MDLRGIEVAKLTLCASRPACPIRSTVRPLHHRRRPVPSANIKQMSDEIAVVTENRPLTGGHFLLSLRSPHQASVTRPGQFAMVRLLDRSDLLLRRPMSIYDVKASSNGRPRAINASSPEIIQLLYKVVGLSLIHISEPTRP